MAENSWVELTDVEESRARVFLSEIAAYRKSALRSADADLGITNAVEGLHKLGLTDQDIADQLGITPSEFHAVLTSSGACG